MNVIDIWDLFKGVYDCDALTEDQWNEANSSFKEECNQAVINYIDENRKNIIFEWASKLGLKKFPKLEATK